MGNMSAKFDEEAHIGLVSILFTRSKCDTMKDARIHTIGQNPSNVTLSPLQRIGGDNELPVVL